MSTNVIFLYVLARFPGFIRHVKSEGADPDVVVRLATFFNLNVRRLSSHFMRDRCSYFHTGHPRSVPFPVHGAVVHHRYRRYPRSAQDHHELVSSL